MSLTDHVVLLVGGVGGAKLALGLSNVLSPEQLTIIVNTGDDFEHLGLHVSPDVDTVMYALAGLDNPETGWGMAGDTFQALEMVKRYGGPSWFGLGDKDIGTNLLRTALLRDGHSLTEVTARLCAGVGVRHPLLPMSDDPVRTLLETDQGTLAFQVYFVRERWQPVVKRIRFDKAEQAHPTQSVTRALNEASLIVFGPSNPYLSIDPILAVPGIRDQIMASSAPCGAVSPIIGGQAVKGPAAKLMAELGVDISALGVARHYENLLDGFILDTVDQALCEPVVALGIRAACLPTLMTTLDDKVQLAEELLGWAEDNLS